MRVLETLIYNIQGEMCMKEKELTIGEIKEKSRALAEECLKDIKNHMDLVLTYSIIKNEILRVYEDKRLELTARQNEED